MDDANVNLKHKDRLFGFIFGRPENRQWTLELYNSVSGKHYDNPDDIDINTLSEVVYMGMKNDVSFLIGSYVNLYEQQSSINPNMPVRELIYIGSVYSGYITKHRYNQYGKKQIPLPVPKLVTFYNGSDNWDDRILRLSDAFPKDIKDDADIEVRVKVININPGKNDAFLATCKPLYEYSWFVSEIRKNRQNGMKIGKATDKAFDEMPKDFLIRPFILQNRAEVKKMCITEYNEEETMQLFKEEGKEEGIAIGKEEGIAIGKEEGIAIGKEEGIAIGKEVAVLDMFLDGGITKEYAAGRLNKNEDEFDALLKYYVEGKSAKDTSD